MLSLRLFVSRSNEISRRPSAFHKNLLAQSLVRSYPALKSSNPDVPQALWFHPNARGKNHHSGRLHYHMEYLARKSGIRIVNRSKTQADETNGAEEAGGDSANPGEEPDMQAVVRMIYIHGVGFGIIWTGGPIFY